MPGSCAMTVSMMRSTAWRGSSSMAGSGRAGPSMPVSPWMSGAVSMVRTSGRSQPAAKGTPVMPAIVRYGQRVAGDLFEGLVAHHRGDGEQLDLRVAVREQQRDRVVMPGVAVKDDLAGHECPEPIHEGAVRGRRADRVGRRWAEDCRDLDDQLRLTTAPGPARCTASGCSTSAPSTPAPITAMLLGDYGADVLKVEHPRGDPARTHGWSVRSTATACGGRSSRATRRR